jgi:hypothetical protein
MTARATLAELSGNGHLTFDRHAKTVCLYDGNPAAGNPRSSLSVSLEVFQGFCNNGWVYRVGGDDVKRRYEISAAGRRALLDTLM